jgi:hypothetical protein
MTDLAKFTVDGLVFSHEDKSDEPLIRDIDLAVRLEYARPRTIRTLIKRMINEGKLPGVHRCCTVQRQRTRRGERSFEVEEFWLTQAQAIKVSARGDTAKGDELLDEVIRVFLLAHKGLLAPPPPPPAGPLLEQLQRLLLSRARVRDNDHAKRLVRGAIGGAATARRESFARTHGALRKAFLVPSYQALTLAEVPSALEWLQTTVKDTPVGLLARQLSLWPMGGAQ